MKNINHKSLWFNSMSGMTIGFMSTLILGTIIGIFGLYSDDNIFISIKNGMVFITPFGIGVGIGYKHKLSPIKSLAVGLSAFIVGRSLVIPHYSDISGFDFTNVEVNISLFIKSPGDVFAAWLAGVAMLYVFEIHKQETSLDIFIIPLIGIFVGIFNSLWLTYLTSLLTVLAEWCINNSINDKLWIGIILAPVFGALMGLALSLPTSSAAIALAINLHGDAATIAIAATAGQMISFGVLTYLSTKNISKSLSVAFGTSMLQMNNYIKKPFLLVIPLIASMVGAMLALASFHGKLPFKQRSTTSGMGSAALYGQIFTLKENGWESIDAWLNIIFIQIITPIIITIGIGIPVIKKGLIKSNDLLY